jgi:hypothetical protein
LLGALAAACAPDPAVDRDAARTADGALAADAAVRDTAVSGHDAVVRRDSAQPHDAGPADASMDRDGATRPDGAAVTDATAAIDAADAADATDAADVGVEDAGLPEDAGPYQTVRIMAANLSSGVNQSYDPGEGLRIIQGLNPDIVLIQEFSIGDNSTAATQAFVQAACGPTCVYQREPVVAGQIPNGVISRFPIVDSGVWIDSSIANRNFVWARLDVPGDRDLWAVSVHLKAASDATSVAMRKTEADELIGYINGAVPEAALLVVGGDLNVYYADPVREPALASFATILVTLPLPDDGTGNTGTSANRLEVSSMRQPYDQVMPDPDLFALIVPVRVGANTYPNGLVFDSRVYTPLTDVPPVLVTDSTALNMQHMAVVRDFALPR